MANKQQVASWYWIVTTALIPAFVIAALMWVNFQQQRSEYRSQASRIELQVTENHKRLVPLQNRMTNVATAIGFGMGDVKAYTEEFTVKAPDGFGEEDQKPEAERNPVYVVMRRTETAYYEGKVQEYMSARKWLENLDLKLRRYIAYKSQEYYTLKTIELGTPEAESMGKLSRSIQEHEERDALVVPADKLENVNLNLNPDADIHEGFMKPPARVSLEMILGKQFELISQLQQANKHQYSLLFSETTGGDSNNPVYVGFAAGNEAVKKANKTKDKLVTGNDPLFDELKEKSDNALLEAKNAEDEAADSAGAAKSDYELRRVAKDQRLTGLEDGFQNEVDAAKRDAEAFKKMTVSIPLIKSVVKLEKAEADGEISFSDFTRKLCHIDLGRSDNVKAGQRFEVWRTHGRKRDKFIGVVEIIRTLSNSYSLCTVLSLADDNDPVRQSDTIVSRLYHKGRFLKVALHGDFEPPSEAYSKARLTEMLRLAGCTVVEKVQPGVDLTVVGSNLLGDEWYRNARKMLRFETMKEDDIRLYIDPR
ncbi:MAG: hypothetical protein ACYTDT_12285 [Planctomycetota bacterium]|jgi:hypothetical protein